MTATASPTGGAFRHEALLYAGESDFLAGTLPFVREAINRQEPILVAVRPEKTALLREALGGDGDAVEFVDMGVLGRNPARIIPAWRQFVDEWAKGAQPVRGIGEPICAGGSETHLVECQIHESLLNVAFDDDPQFRLLCPYDTSLLDAVVLDEARLTHSFLLEHGVPRRSDTGPEADDPMARLEGRLPEPRRRPSEMAFDADQVHQVRSLVSDVAQKFGMAFDRVESFVVATNEVLLNTVRHGGGEGVVRVWHDGEFIVCEVRDKGHFHDPLVGRHPPDASKGRGLWLVNTLCDLVQIRNHPDGAVVRLHMALAGEAERRLTHLTLHDQLTGLGNRTMLRNRLEHALAAGTRDPRRHAVLFCDLNGLKWVNDTYGHRIGDEALVAVAGRLREGARPGDTIARLGGDEFVVLCEGVATDSDAQLIAERLARALDAPIATTGGVLSLSMSIGVALSRPGQSADDLLAEADAAMYAAKRARS